MQFAVITSIKIGDRVRVPTDAAVEALANDIQEKGLFHPVVVTNHDDRHLVAGETRIRAIQLIDERAQERGYVGEYRFNGGTHGCDFIPYVTVGDLNARQMLEYEIAENVIRSDIPWQDRVNAIAKLQAANELGRNEPGTMKTVHDLIAGGDKRKLPSVHAEVSKAIIVSAHLNDPDVAKAKNVTDAWTVVRNKNEQLQRKLLSAAMTAEATLVSPHRLIHGDMCEQLQGMESETFDLIIADPPYGTNADQWTSKFVDAPHDYKDDMKTAARLHYFLFNEGFRVCKERANMFVLCDPKFWHNWEQKARLAGWATWPRPLIWKKSMEGIRPWGTAGFAYTYEAILYCTKGRKGLLKSVNDVIDVYKVVSNRLHGAQKPVELFSYLMEIASLPGDTVLDPTCGSGTIFPAASASKLIATGIEVNEEYLTIAEARRQETAQPVREIVDDLEDLL
jgi:site-specific DNA-methyltransferase (adenine-specific)